MPCGTTTSTTPRRSRLTGSRDGYLFDYAGRAQEFVSCVRRGFLYQGQWYAWQRQPRGSPLRGSAASACVVFLENHDQVGNTFTGVRMHQQAAPARYRALMALTAARAADTDAFHGPGVRRLDAVQFFADHGADLAPQGTRRSP